MKNKNKRILLYLGHPAHYHNLKLVARELESQGCEVLFVARQKDVLFRLLEESTIKTVDLPARTSTSKLGLIWSILQREWLMWRIVSSFKPDIMAGTDLVIAHIGRIKGIPSVLINEDDLDQVALFAKYGVRFCTVNLAPDVCRVAGYEAKTLHYKSYHELAYLHPDHFEPNAELLTSYIDTENPFYIIRFAQLTAHHDEGKSGLTGSIAKKVVEKLRSKGNVYITSERPLEPEFEPYRIGLPPHLMHHALALAAGYVGDSQTMAAEAAVLGTPSLRYNDFVGKLSYLDELEHKYQLTFGFTTDQPDEFLKAVEDILGDSDTAKWQQRRRKMLGDKQNLMPLWTNFLLHYPHQKDIPGFFN